MCLLQLEFYSVSYEHIFDVFVYLFFHEIILKITLRNLLSADNF